MPDDIKLKPCPFCGAPGHLKRSLHDGIEYAQATCTGRVCPANNMSSPPQSAVDAARIWNTRSHHA